MIAPKNFAAKHELYHWMIECLKRDLIDRKISPLLAQERLNANPTCELGGGSPNDYFFELVEKYSPSTD